jgi:uncharacterized sulfatase
LLTGRLPVRTGLYGRRLGVLYEDDPGGLPDSEVTLAERLASVGYRTGMLGKWHLGDRPEALPTRHGFEQWLGLPFSNDMRWTVGLSFVELIRAVGAGRTEIVEADRRLKRLAYFAPRREAWNVPLLRSTSAPDGWHEEIVEQPVEQTTVTRRLTEEAVAFFERHRDEPFFLYLAYSMPHVPLFPHPDHYGKSRAGTYGDVVDEIDWSAGRLLDELHALRLAERTLVVFTSDNGPWLAMDQLGGSAGPLRHGKGTTFEGGVRVPALFWWPGTIRPATIGDLGSTMDLLPTVLSLAGAPAPTAPVLDGLDLSPVLRGEAPGSRVSLPYYRGGELYAWRHGAMKIHFITEGAYQMPPPRQEHDPPLLYHLGEDPGERFDLAVQRPDVVRSLVAEADAHRRSTSPASPLFDQRLTALFSPAAKP